jgi:chromodomain-helicase-DNA-binding protein 4
MHLIDGQPLHLLDETISVPNPPLKKSKHMHSTSVPHSTSNGKSVANSFPMSMPPPGPVAFSKRTSSPIPTEQHSSKKHKVQPAPSSCVLCGRSPFHLVKDCPTVLEGPKRYGMRVFSIKLADISFCSVSRKKSEGFKMILGTPLLSPYSTRF